MSTEASTNSASRSESSHGRPSGGSSTSGISSWWTVPKPVRRLFKQFPLVTYPANDLPIRSLHARHQPTLYVFTAEEDAPTGLPSFNPSCLKWQTFLRLAGIQHRLQSSTNHASPSGALPFLQPASTPSDPSTQSPISSAKLENYAIQKGRRKVGVVTSPKLEAYQSLLDHRIRDAWLYTLYLSPANTPLLERLYVTPLSRSYIVRTATLHQLRSAAEAEILKSTNLPAVDPARLYSEAREAFSALSVLLDSDDWFFGGSEASLFDASVFAYTYLLLDDDMTWQDRSLTNMLEEFPSLFEHRNRVAEWSWGGHAYTEYR